MLVLGISAHFHDSAAALIEDGHILAAAQEERFTRIKHDASLPQQAIAYCLSQAPGRQPDVVVLHEKPLLKFHRILHNALACAPRGLQAFRASIPEWLGSKLWLPAAVEECLDKLGHGSRHKIAYSSHHLSHAASAFLPSPWHEAAVLTIDGVGEWATATLACGKGGELRILRELRYPHSPGLLYSAFTHHCGFRVNSGEYKLMGLAPYGKPVYKDRILDEIVQVADDGSLTLNLRHFSFQNGDAMTASSFGKVLGCERRSPEAEIAQVHCDLAASIQEVNNLIVLRMAGHLRELSQQRHLCMAGGVALNCVSNGILQRSGLFDGIWVQPAAGDAGGALGAALAWSHGPGGIPRTSDGVRDRMRGSRLGPAYTELQIGEILRGQGIEASRANSIDEAAESLAEELAQGRIVGLLQGRAEFGPRALGSRSILADPRNPAMQSKLNLSIKFRESFRPFAPVVLEEDCAEHFDYDRASPYMLFTAPIKAVHRLPCRLEGSLPERLAQPRSHLPAITHLDYSARLQTVGEEEDPYLRAILKAFKRLTGCPVLINTSFNVRGEPPVCSPSDAISCFLSTDIDVLALETHLIHRSKLPPEVLEASKKRPFPKD